MLPAMGTTGAMRWDTLAKVAGAAGFTTPYLTCASPLDVVKQEYRDMLSQWRKLEIEGRGRRERLTDITRV